MLDPISKTNAAGDHVQNHTPTTLQDNHSDHLAARSSRLSQQTPMHQQRRRQRRHQNRYHVIVASEPQTFHHRLRQRQLPKNFLLKRLDKRYWKRLVRYLYIRFVRMQSSPRAIARGVAAGVFAGSFPLIGLQSVLAIAIASLIRGNKVVAAAGTFISNPLTSVPIFALNFQVGRLLLGLPMQSALPASLTDINEWINMGLDVAATMMLGSLAVGIVASILSYYIGLKIAQQVHTAKANKRKRQQTSPKISPEISPETSLEASQKTPKN